MATVLDFINQTRTKLAALTPALATQVTNSNYRTDMDDLAVGSTHYRLRFQEQQTLRDSNQQIQSVAMEVEISHNLADRFDEEAYTEVAMLAHMLALLDKEWWRTMAAVREVRNAPDVEENVEREGNVISWSVLVVVAIAP